MCVSRTRVNALMASGARDLVSTLDIDNHPRGSSRPSFAPSLHPQMKEGAGKTGCPAGTRGPLCEDCATRGCTAAYRCSRNIRPSLRSGLTAYVVISPGSDALLPPSPCRWLMGGPGWAASITTRLDAQTPGARTTRFCRTRITPVVGAIVSLTVARPAKPDRADVTCVHRRPARVRDDRDTPLFLGPGCRDTYAVSEFR
ncbi:hypothetical protein M2427_002252 [Bradyrhizobium sp. BR13661]|nr:hypothetical protein [Bradyrhizobium sp. BR13661]